MLFDEQSEKLNSLLEECEPDDILSEIGEDTVGEWFKKQQGINPHLYLADEDDVIEQIKGVEYFLHPRGYHSKEDIKKDICDFIDFWM